VLVQELFQAHAGPTKIILASRFEETAVYNVGNATGRQPVVNNHIPSVSQLQFAF
jgi:hypothetical protein